MVPACKGHAYNHIERTELGDDIAINYQDESMYNFALAHLRAT